MKNCFIILSVLVFFIVFSPVNGRESIYELGNSDLTIAFSSDKNGVPEIVSARKHSLMQLSFSLGQTIFTPGQVDDASKSFLPAAEYSPPVPVSNSKEFYELRLRATAKGTKDAPADYSADLGIYVSRNAPVILINLRQLRSTGTQAARVDFFDWNFLLSQENYEISFSSDTGALLRNDEYFIRVFPLKGKASFTGTGAKNIQARLQPPWRFYLEPRETWDGFGPFLCIVITPVSNELPPYEETFQQASDFLKSFERPEATPTLE